jgi:hypothetical protein
MIENEIWNHLDSYNVCKIFILFKAKFKNKTKKVEIVIENIMATTKCGNNNIDFQGEIHNDKSFLTKPIYNEYENLVGKVNCILTYDNENKKIILSGKIEKKIFQNFQKEITEIN